MTRIPSSFKGRVSSLFAAFGLFACGKGEVPTAVPVAVDVSLTDSQTASEAIGPDPAASEREKVLALAVASECMRKSGVPQAQATQTMLSLYRAHQVELETYTRVMTKLSADPTFTAEVERLTKECPEVVIATDTQVALVADTSPQDTTAVEAPDTLPSSLPDAGPVRDVELRDGTPEVKDVKSPSEVVDTQEPTDAKNTPPRDTHGDGKDLSGPWTGALNGKTPGTLRVVVRGRDVLQAVATIGRKTYKLKGSISDAGAVLLAGTEGNDFIRITGRLEQGHKAFSGQWNGVVGRQRVDGRFRILR